MESGVLPPRARPLRVSGHAELRERVAEADLELVRAALVVPHGPDAYNGRPR